MKLGNNQRRSQGGAMGAAPPQSDSGGALPPQDFEKKLYLSLRGNEREEEDENEILDNTMKTDTTSNFFL